MEMTYKNILPGINLRFIESDRFETNCISINFLSNSDEATVSHMTLVPRVLRRGTVRHPDMESLAAALDDMYGARIEPVSRKYGDIMTSGFICDFVDAEEKNLSSVMKLVYEILFEYKQENGTFSEEYVSGERANLIDEIKSEINNKLSYAHRRATEKMFSDSAYAISELGTEEAAESIDANSLLKYYKRMISESPCEIFFCGNYSQEEVEVEISKLFRHCTRKNVKAIKSESPKYAENLRVCEKLDVSQANLLIGMYAEDVDNYVMKLLGVVIGGGTTSKLFRNVREKNSLCYFAGAMYDSFKKNIFMYCGIDPKNAKIAEDAVRAEFSDCVSGNISDEELYDAKKAMVDDFITVEDSFAAMEAFWLRATLIGDERTPAEVVSEIKKTDKESVISAACSLKLSVTYLLTGLESVADERKLLSNN